MQGDGSPAFFLLVHLGAIQIKQHIAGIEQVIGRDYRSDTFRAGSLFVQPFLFLFQQSHLFQGKPALHLILRHRLFLSEIIVPGFQRLAHVGGGKRTRVFVQIDKSGSPHHITRSCTARCSLFLLLLFPGGIEQPANLTDPFFLIP